MLVILLLFASFRSLRGVLSSPTAAADEHTFSLRDSETGSHLGQRGVNDLIISCFAVIFACTWTAIHPNIPAVTDCWWTRFKRQMTTMGCALIAPELVTIWALRQHTAAREIVTEYNREILKGN